MESLKIKVVIFYGLISIFGLLTGCDNNQTNNQLDAATKEKVENMVYKVEKEFPGNKMPKHNGIEDLRLRRLLTVTKDNHLILDDEQDLILAGINCNKESLSTYLNSMLNSQRNNDRLAIEYTGLESGDSKYAYVWGIVFYGKKLTGSSWHLINEVLMSSGHCVAIDQEKHDYYERYLKLQEIGDVLKKYRDSL